MHPLEAVFTTSGQIYTNMPLKHTTLAVYETTYLSDIYLLSKKTKAQTPIIKL